ncbi:hypothetical protein [Methyloceanibacter sp.]|uniref:hypothetical protein n=1 Tax=Methyloceanibacter sp. TaxID=1965321 RepID=UPI002C2E6598|nr:hypothetical protein [Methyloceanibacter sp.]HML91458.1 hypothetical protein [Methyloceanibacter sp.]
MTLPSLRFLAGSRWILAGALVLTLCLAVSAPPFAVAQDAPEDSEAATGQAAPSDAGQEDAGQEDAGQEDEAADDTDTGDTPADAEAGDEADAPAGPWEMSKPCENAQHPYQADLCTQWRAAEAAERTAGLTRLLMLIGALALLLLLAMFVPLMMAVRAARRAAQGGGAGAPVSPRTADREAELRAYVDVDSLEFVETPEAEGIVKVKIALRNSGQTPAFKLESVADMAIHDISTEELLPVLPLPEESSLVPVRPRLGRDATATVIVECESTPKFAERVTSGEATILVWGAVGYFDVFDRRRRTVFQYLCNAETLDTGQMFKPMTRGDEDG